MQVASYSILLKVRQYTDMLTGLTSLALKQHCTATGMVSHMIVHALLLRHWNALIK